MSTQDPPHRHDALETTVRRREAAGTWWHVAVAVLVAPFYVGLYVITAVGALLSPRNGA